VIDNGSAYAVFADDPDHLRVVDAACPHRGGPIVEGLVRDGAVVCPWHWYTYDLDTGECRNARRYRLRCYAVVERDGASFAVIPRQPRQLSWAERLRAHARGER
jgi:nitrite reductase/ring-hydroxylating ferredoxin subunit